MYILNEGWGYYWKEWRGHNEFWEGNMELYFIKFIDLSLFPTSLFMCLLNL